MRGIPGSPGSESVILGGSSVAPRWLPGGLSLWVATFFLCSLPRQGALFRTWTDKGCQLGPTWATTSPNIPTFDIYMPLLGSIFHFWGPFFTFRPVSSIISTKIMAWASTLYRKSLENPRKSTDILWKFQQVVEMAEKAEKPGFTFFAFLPPYIGVSSFLVYPQGKSFSRSIDWYRKFFISCLLARYRKFEICRHIMKISTGVRNGWKCRKTRFTFFAFLPVPVPAHPNQATESGKQ